MLTSCCFAAPFWRPEKKWCFGFPLIGTPKLEQESHPKKAVDSFFEEIFLGHSGGICHHLESDEIHEQNQEVHKKQVLSFDAQNHADS